MTTTDQNQNPSSAKTVWNCSCHKDPFKFLHYKGKISLVIIRLQKFTIILSGILQLVKIVSIILKRAREDRGYTGRRELATPETSANATARKPDALGRAGWPTFSLARVSHF